MNIFSLFSNYPIIYFKSMKISCHLYVLNPTYVYIVLVFLMDYSKHVTV